MSKQDERLDRLAEAFTETPEMAAYLDFIDTANEAIERGDKEATLPTAFLSRAIHEFQPMDYPHLRETWNRLCDEMGLPEEKKPVPAAAPQGGAEEGPF